MPSRTPFFAAPLLLSALVAAPLAACSGSEGGAAEDDKIIGDNNFVAVAEDGSNIPAKYKGLLDAFGLGSMTCTMTHLGDGLVLTAGHCVDAPPVKNEIVPCGDVAIRWGFRGSRSEQSLPESRCERILVAKDDTKTGVDFALLLVDNPPSAKVPVTLATTAKVGTKITIFGHPKGRPLEWSKTCTIQPGTSFFSGDGGLDADAANGPSTEFFAHQCDTEPGNSGSTVLDDKTLAVVGIHDGGYPNWNYGTYVTRTAIADWIGKVDGPKTAFMYPSEGDVLEGEVSVTMRRWMRNGTVGKIVVAFPDGTKQTIAANEDGLLWDSRKTSDGPATITATAYDAKTGAAGTPVKLPVTIRNTPVTADAGADASPADAGRD